jgi:hypothetical protein
VKPRNTRETVVFLLRIDRLWVGGPGLLAAWGMSGETTLAWAYRLGHDLAYLLDGPRFVMAKMTFDGPPSERHTRSSWAADQPVEILLDLQGKEAALDAILPNYVLPAAPPARRVAPGRVRSADAG